jgi:hypothetical protein
MGPKDFDDIESNSFDPPQPWTIQASWKVSDYSFHSKVFGSPAVKMRISPILTLPHEALGTICEFLSGIGGGRDGGGEDLKRLEATCRSLSVILMSARVSMEKDRSVRAKLIEQEMAKNMLEKGDRAGSASAMKGVTLDDMGRSLISPTKGKISDMNRDSASADELNDELVKASPTHRSSKRVRSQLITSGKQAERIAKRKSVEYCLISSLFFCTCAHPAYSHYLNKKLPWEDIQPLCKHVKRIETVLDTCHGSELEANGRKSQIVDKDTLSNRILDSAACMGISSLSNFIHRYNGSNSGSLDLLERFLCHVSCFVENVYRSEKGGVMVMTACIMECELCMSVIYNAI